MLPTGPGCRIRASQRPQGVQRGFRREESGIVVPDLKLHGDSGKRERTDAGRGRGGSALAGPASSTQRVLTLARGAAVAAPGTLWRNHRLFTILALVSLLPRILAACAFRPALLTADSFLYMDEAVHSTLGTIRPSGYSFFLRVLEPFRSLLFVTTAQHLMGVAVAAIVYGLLRYHGLPGWGRRAGGGPHAIRHPADRAGVLHPAGHAVLPRDHARRRAAAYQEDTAAVAMRRGRPAAGLRVS